MESRKSNVTYSSLEAQHLVRALYRALLGREADATGLAYWTDTLVDGRLDLAALTTTLTASDEYRATLAHQHAQAGLRARVAAAATTALADAPLRIVDVGAQILADEQHVYAALAGHGLPCHIVGFEPIADKLTERRQADGATVRMYPDFIGDGSRHTFHLNVPDATSSLLPFNTVLTGQLVHLSQLRTARTEQVGSDPGYAPKRQALDDIAQELNIRFFFPLDQQKSVSVSSAVADLHKAGLVIADLSLERPSCYFEVGVAQGIGKTVAFIAATGTPIHQVYDTAEPLR